MKMDVEGKLMLRKAECFPDQAFKSISFYSFSIAAMHADPKLPLGILADANLDF